MKNSKNYTRIIFLRQRWIIINYVSIIFSGPIPSYFDVIVATKSKNAEKKIIFT